MNIVITSTNLSELLLQIELDGPKVLDPFINEYFDLTGLEINVTDKISENIKISLNSFNNKNFTEETIRRKNFISKYGFSVPSELALQKIYNFCDQDKILEIGSGMGLWAHLMKLSGLNVYATDIGSDGKYYKDFSRTWTKIEMITHEEAIEKYKSECNVLFTSWPPIDKLISFNMMHVYTCSKIIYIGECYGGSTANTNFFDILNKLFVLIETVTIPRWTGIYDKMYFFERK